MRVVAARFSGPRVASVVLDRLQRHVQCDPEDIEIAPLGTPGRGATDETLLAGYFREEEAQRAIEVLRRAGGEIVVDIDERWTRPARPDVPQGRGRGGLIV
jgi:hypothetical protein